MGNLPEKLHCLGETTTAEKLQKYDLTDAEKAYAVEKFWQSVLTNATYAHARMREQDYPDDTPAKALIIDDVYLVSAYILTAKQNHALGFGLPAAALLSLGKVTQITTTAGQLKQAILSSGKYLTEEQNVPIPKTTNEQTGFAIVGTIPTDLKAAIEDLGYKLL